MTWPGVAGKLYRTQTSSDLATWANIAPLTLAKAQATGDAETYEQVAQQLVRKLKRREDDCEEKKEKVRAK